MLPELYLRVHTVESDMTSVIFSCPYGIEFLVIYLCKVLSPFGILPYPISKCSLYRLLLLLCYSGLLMIEYRDLIAFFVIHIIKDTGVTQI